MQERSPCDQIGWKQRQESGQDLSLGKKLWRGKVPSPWAAPSPVGRSAKTERKLQRLRGEHSLWLAAGKTEKPAQRLSASTLCSPIQDARLLVCPGTERSPPTSEGRPREKAGLIWAETAAVAKVWSNPSQNWRSDTKEPQPGSATEVPLLMCMPKGRGGACHSSVILKVLTKGAAPRLWTLGVCKHWQAAHM